VGLGFSSVLAFSIVISALIISFPEAVLPMNSCPPESQKAPRFSVALPLAFITTSLILIAGLVVQPVMTAREQARKTLANNCCWQIEAALKAYYAEYGRYPLGERALPNEENSAVYIFGQSPNSPSIGSGVSNAELLDILRNVDSTGATPLGQPTRYNPKGIIFFDDQTATDPSKPRTGLVPTNAKAPAHPGALVDPWGTEYFIAISSKPDSRLTNLPYKDFQNENAPHCDIGVFSLGKDQRLGTKGDGFYKDPSTSAPSDDVITWQ
jgi:type II secretory pathway pseudopilin PulG